MTPEAITTATMISLGLLPLGNVALFLSTRGSSWSLMDIPVFFGHLSGYPAGALVAVLSSGAGLAPGLAWLLTATAYDVSMGAGIGLRSSLVTVERG